jgi:sulfur carrier protein ThiS
MSENPGINLDKDDSVNLDKVGGTVSVSQFGDDEVSVAIDGPTSVAQCLARAGIETPLAQGQAVSVNGTIVKDLSTTVEAGAIVVVAGNISNG